MIRAGETVFVLSSADPMDVAVALLDRVASSKLPVLVLGETGTGKERLARRIHERSGRSGSFVALNCATLSPDLTAAELFGHTRGAFSGAATSRQGLFRRADEGTLFLDEIGDLSPALQPMLLRALQEGSVRPVGGDEEISVNARIVAATHVTLEVAVEEQRFRGDLYSRLARSIVRLPPLRERRVSLLSIAREIAHDAGACDFQLTADAAEALTRYEWPYNVRQLESLVQGFVTTEPGGVLDLSYLSVHLPEVCRDFRVSSSPNEESEDRPPQGDRRSLEALLVRHRGNVSHVAEALGKPRSQVYRWFKAFGLVPSRYRRSSL